jgi:uncharacterized coiled-coil protein SlyX
MENESRLQHLEDKQEETTRALDELTVVVMGPLPARDNGIRGNLKLLTEKVNNLPNEIYEKVKSSLKEDPEVTSAKINLKGVYIMSGLNFLAMIFVALITKGII